MKLLCWYSKCMGDDIILFYVMFCYLRLNNDVLWMKLCKNYGKKFYLLVVNLII